MNCAHCNAEDCSRSRPRRLCCAQCTHGTLTESQVLFAFLRRDLVADPSEKTLRERIEQCIAKAGMVCQADVRMGQGAGVIDFLFPESGYAAIVISRITSGQLLERASRVARDRRVSQLLVISTRAAHREDLPNTLHDKPIDVFWIGGAS